MDDLNNNQDVEPEVKGMSSSSSSKHRTCFSVSLSNNNTSISMKHPQLAHEDLQQIHPDDIEEMGLRWKMDMLNMRATRAPKNQDNKHKEGSRRSLPIETSTSTAMVSCNGLGGYDWSDQAKEGPNYALMAYSSSSSDSKFKTHKAHRVTIVDNCKKGKFVNDPAVENCKAMSSEQEPKGNPQMDLHDQGVIDSGSSRHMTGNMSYLTDYEDIDGGYVAFGGNPKGGKITGKREMNQFCEMKGILRQFSVARTLQQNGVADRRNRTLIEAARTMLADFLKTPTLSFMRPFGCSVTILNTIDHLGKFDGKADEGSGPDWLFDIDALTRIMNYEPIIAGTKSNGFVDPKSSHDDGSKPSSDDGKKVDEDPTKDSECNDQEKEDDFNSTNNVNAASTNEVNVVGGKTCIELPFDPDMPALEDISIFDFSRDDEDDGVEADMNDLDTTIQVSHIPTTRIHKDHPFDQVNGRFAITTQTRRMSKNLEEHGFVSTIQQRTNHKDLQNCLFACFLSQEEPKKVIHALKDPSWIEAMQEELLQFKLQEIEEEVYVCQPLGFKDPDFPDRVYKVEKVLYGLHQAPRAWYETLSTYLLDNGFQRVKIDKTLFIKRHKGNISLVQVYVDDIIFDSTKKELCNAFEKLMHEKF
ncbi:putative ribonuclease H-like domain-containing protein [Tanacetum coccineum]